MSSSYAPSSPSPLIKQSSREDVPEESFFERWLIMPKLLYFILNMYIYALHSLLGFFFTDQWRFPYYVYGYATIIYATNFFGSMVWSSLADRTGRYKLIVIMTTILFTATAVPLGLYRSESSPGEGVSFNKIALVMVGFGLYNFFLSAAFPLLDAQILGMLSRNPRLSKDQFNNQRMFGAVGHFLSTLISMLLYNAKDPNDNGVIYFQLAVSALFVLVVWLGVEDVKPVKRAHGHHAAPPEAVKGKEVLERGTSERLSPDGPQQVPLTDVPPTSMTPAPPSAADELASEGAYGERHPIRSLLLSPNFMFFMLFVACAGVIRSVSSSFQKLLGMKASKDDKLKTAAMDFGRMFSEILVYLIAKPVKECFGVYWVLVLSQVVGIVRVLGYGYMDLKGEWAVWYGNGLELLKGFSSGLVSSSAIPIASRIAPAGCENSAQGLYSGNYSGLSMALGGLIGGIFLHVMYDANFPEQDIYSCQAMFRWVAIGCSVVTLLMMAKFIFMDRVMGIPGFPRRHSLPK